MSDEQFSVLTEILQNQLALLRQIGASLEALSSRVDLLNSSILGLSNHLIGNGGFSAVMDGFLLGFCFILIVSYIFLRRR